MHQAARAISTLFNPFLTTLTFFVILSHALATTSSEFWRLLFLTSFFTAIGPMLFISWCHATNRISDLDMSIRSEREAIFGVFVAFYLSGTLAAAFLHAPPLLVASLAGYTANTFIVCIITQYWKISTHTLGITAPLVALWVLYQPTPLPFFVLIPLVGWARVYLKAHTLAQALAGTALAAATVLVFFRLYHVA